MYSNSNSWEGDTTAICIGVLMFLIGVFGSIVNIHNVIAMHRSKEFGTSYGFLCIARGVCNIVNLFLFVLYTAPDTILIGIMYDVAAGAINYIIYSFSKLLPPGDEVGRTSQLFTGIFYAAIPIIQLGVAYNRVIAIRFPFSYNKLCSKKSAVVFISLGLSYGMFISMHEIVGGCRFTYNPNILSWEYSICSRKTLEIKLIYPVMVIAGTTLILNFLIALRIVIEQLKNSSFSHSKKKNVRLFWQGFTQEMFFANDLLWQNFLGNLIETRIWWFIASTLMWELAHICDGLVFLIFDSHLRQSLWNFCSGYTRASYIQSKAKSTTITVTATT